MTLCARAKIKRHTEERVERNYLERADLTPRNSSVAKQRAMERRDRDKGVLRQKTSSIHLIPEVRDKDTPFSMNERGCLRLP